MVQGETPIKRIADTKVNAQLSYTFQRRPCEGRRLLLLLLFTVIEFSLSGSSPYTSTDKTNKKKYTQTKQYKTQYMPSDYILCGGS